MREFPSTPHQYNILKLALITAYKQQAAFTRTAFARQHHLKDNRHLADALHAMVADGILKRWSVMFSDQRPRDVYTRVPFGNDVEESNRVAQQVRRYASGAKWPYLDRFSTSQENVT